MGTEVNETSLKGTQYGRVKTLTGFRKGMHRVPDANNDATQGFVKRIGEPDVREQADELYASMRKAFSLKRRQMEMDGEGAHVTIKVPAFDVTLSLVQDADDVTGYVLTTEISAIRDAIVVYEDAFVRLFSPYCDTVVFDFTESVVIEDVIDCIEDVPGLEDHLEYDPACTYLRLELVGLNISMYLQSHQMEFKLSRVKGDLRLLLDNAQEAYTTITSKGMVLPLPQK